VIGLVYKGEGNVMQSRFDTLPEREVLSVFFTAGYPRRDDTVTILRALQAAGVHLVEIGFPFSDPVADGPTIQESNQRALAQGMNVAHLFEQLRGIREGGVSIPVILMGYLNPIERFGVERFFKTAAECGIDGFILPDMPFDEYLERYRPLYREYGMKPVFLITSRTEEGRIRAFDAEEPAFLYVLSSDAVTGGRAQVTHEREGYFKRLRDMKLRSKLLVGFGVSDRESYQAVTLHTHGAIVGSAFLRAIAELPAGEHADGSSAEAVNVAVSEFVAGIVGNGKRRESGAE
jgi:tryptophan synthase alpha chain